ncbi:hypothetical protein [Povalibacter sp.]|uniref:hypothetical protein n=1 Tax=Povalibacter sp. TaxID=1962978 RepID=UPI002F3ED1EA
MPFEISKETDHLLIQLSGSLSGEELLAMGRELRTLEEANPSFPRIADLTSIETLNLGFLEIEALANVRRALVLAVPMRSALIARRPLHIGYARMFQSLNDNPRISIRIYGTREEALQWLKE